MRQYLMGFDSFIHTHPWVAYVSVVSGLVLAYLILSKFKDSEPDLTYKPMVEL